MLLSDTGIKKALKAGDIHIDPFHEKQLNNCSYDLTLGNYFWRVKAGVFDKFRPHDPFFNAKDWYDLFDARKTNDEITLNPGEFVLAHTNEFAGTLPNGKKAYNSQLHGTSRAARFGVEVCSDAGWGDIGFFNRWTLELVNKTQRRMALPVGGIISQLVFIEASSKPENPYHEKGSFQKYGDIESVTSKWKPEDMLPKRLKLGVGYER